MHDTELIFIKQSITNFKQKYIKFVGGFPGGSAVMNLPAKQEMQKTLVQSPGLEDLLEEEMGTNSSILA